MAPAQGAVGGSPLYRLAPDHAAAAMLLLLVALLVVRLVRGPGARSRSPLELLLFALVAGSAAVHAGLALGDDHGGGANALFALDALLLALVARRVWRGSPVGRLGVAVLLGSIAAYCASALRGDAPDQLGLLTKTAEILALAIVAPRPLGAAPRPLRSAAAGAAVVLLVVGTAASVWIGAFRASAATHDEVAGHHVHGGAVAPPGTVLPAVPERDATAGERRAVAQFVVTARAALGRYADPAVAAADGYRVDGMRGIDFHAPNPSYEKDGHVFDPERPETLVYALAPDGRPVLMGALFLMPELGQAGPTIGGPLTVWHAHEQICFSLVPPTLAGLVSPFGMCPLGSIAVPLSGEMIHLWLVPGAPVPFGDLDEAWKRAYLAALVAER